MANLFKALGHPARVSILEVLVKNERQFNCKEITAEIPLSASTITRHLEVLFNSRIIGAEVVANKTYYVVNPIILEVISGYIKQTKKYARPLMSDFRNVYFYPEAKSLKTLSSHPQPRT